MRNPNPGFAQALEFSETCLGSMYELEEETFVNQVYLYILCEWCIVSEARVLMSHV